MQIKVGDAVKVREGSKASPLFTNLVEKLKDFIAPGWVSFDPNTLEGKVLAKPKNSDSFICNVEIWQ